MAEQEEEVALEDVDKIDADEILDISEIEYDGKSLTEWEKELTISMPSFPCTSQAITPKLIDLFVKYQVAYNVYNDLTVRHDKVVRAYKKACGKKVTQYLKMLEDKKVKATPAMDKIEAIVLNKSEALMELKHMCLMLDTLRQFFEQNKNKLGRIIDLAKDISYSIRASDNVYQKGTIINGIQDSGSR